MRTQAWILKNKIKDMLPTRQYLPLRKAEQFKNLLPLRLSLSLASCDICDRKTKNNNILSSKLDKTMNNQPQKNFIGS